MKDDIKKLYKKNPKLAIKAAKALGYKIIAKDVKDNVEIQRMIDTEKELKRGLEGDIYIMKDELKTLYLKDPKLAVEAAKILGYKITAIKKSKQDAKGKKVNRKDLLSKMEKELKSAFKVSSLGKEYVNGLKLYLNLILLLKNWVRLKKRVAGFLYKIIYLMTLLLNL